MLEDTRQVLWTQGLFMQPQHFQAADLATDSRLRSLRCSSDPWPWGIHAISFSAGGLQNNQVDITGLRAVFQDGAEVALPGNAVVPPRSFEKAWTQPDRPFMIYLGLRRHNPAGGNVTPHEAGEIPRMREGDFSSTRYVSSYSPAKLPDSHGDGPPESVRKLDYLINIFWETEIGDMADCDFIPVARLIRVGEGAANDPSFVPPALTLAGFPLLKQVVEDVRDQLLGRAARLEEYKPVEGRLEQWTSDPKAFSMLLTLLLLNRNIPALDFAAENDTVRPWSAYLTLRQLAAELTSLVPGINAMGESEKGEKLLPVYKHIDPAASFVQARNLIGSLLSRLASGPEHMIRMEAEQGGVLVAKLPDSFFNQNLKHFLMIRSNHHPAMIREEAVRFGKLCSLASLRDIINQALPGIPLRPVDNPPVGLPRRSDTTYFEINSTSPLWRDLIVQEDKSLAFSWEGGGEETVAHLAALRAL